MTPESSLARIIKLDALPRTDRRWCTRLLVECVRYSSPSILSPWCMAPSVYMYRYTTRGIFAFKYEAIVEYNKVYKCSRMYSSPEVRLETLYCGMCVLFESNFERCVIVCWSATTTLPCGGAQVRRYEGDGVFFCILDGSADYRVHSRSEIFH